MTVVLVLVTILIYILKFAWSKVSYFLCEILHKSFSPFQPVGVRACKIYSLIFFQVTHQPINYTTMHADDGIKKSDKKKESA